MNIWYYGFILMGAAFAIFSFCHALFNKKRGSAYNIKAILIAVSSCVISFLFSIIFNYFTFSDIAKIQYSEHIYALGFRYYCNLVSFSAVYCLLSKIILKQVDANILAMPLALFLFFSRFGCLSVGCCGGIAKYPAQIVEIIFAGFFILLFTFTKGEQKLPIYIISYSIFRLVTGFFRVDYSYKILFLTPTQYLCVFAIIFTTIYIVYNTVFIATKNKKRKMENER